MQIRWSTLAVDDLERICAWIAEDSSEAAQRVAQIIYEGCSQLRNFPSKGRPSERMNGRRELIFSPLPYIAVYRIDRNIVEISRIFHGAQDWP